MTFRPIEIVNVNYHNGTETLPCGRLAISNRKIFFEYDAGFLQKNLHLSPFKLPLRAGIIACEDRDFEGLFGVFNDSLPDGWGRLLVDRELIKIGVNPTTITPLDRLCYTGGNGTGALMYEPEISDVKLNPRLKNLDAIADECLQFQEKDTDKFVDELLAMNGSSAGARPKILVSVAANEKLELTSSDPKISHDNWLIKFRSFSDPKDVGCIEYAYSLMARKAGLDVPETKLFSSKKCGGYFGVKRFDRQRNSFIHMHSASGLLHLDHRLANLDYEILLKATMHLTRDIRQCEKQFRHAVFNVMTHNRDDHAKNFSFLMDYEGKWQVSPAYDLTFSAGPVGQHSTTILGEGKNPSRAHFLKLAEVVSIKKKTAETIIDEVKFAVSNWNNFAKKSAVTAKSQKSIEAVLKRIAKDL